jgi:Glycosyl transferases group 1
MLKKGRTFQILLHGLVYFCRKFPGFLATPGWEFRHFDPHQLSAHIPAALYLQRCDLAYCWGGRVSLGKFLAMARLLRKKNVVQFWCGSDTLNARKDYDAGRVDSWVAERIHWAGSPWLAEEVRAMGLHCEYVPSTWVEIPNSVPPMPKEFSVLTHLPSESKFDLYGMDHLFEVARKLPQIKFNVVGILPGERLEAPANVTVHGRVPSMYPFFQNTSVFWRPARHDGLAFVSLEALAHGRHVLWSYLFPGARVAPNAITGYQEIQRLYDLHCDGKLQVNRFAAEYIAANFNPRIIREGILTRWMRIIQSLSGGYAPGYCDEQAVR